MNVIRLLFRFTLICNFAFLISIVMRWLEMKYTVNNSGNIMPIPFVKEVIIILGVVAIFINIIMNLLSFILLVSKKLFVARWIVITNLVFLIIELYYNFLS